MFQACLNREMQSGSIGTGLAARYVLLIVPGDDASILTRELHYAGLLVPETTLKLWSPESVLRAAIFKRL